VAGFVVPSGWLGHLAHLTFATTAAVIVWLMVWTLRRGRRGPWASRAILMLALLLAVAGVAEMLADLNVIPRPNLFLPALTLYPIVVSAILVLLHTDEKELYSQLVEQSADAIVVLGPEGVVREVNDAALTLLGVPLGSRLADLVAPDSQGALAELLRANGGAPTAELTLHPPAGAAIPAEVVAISTPDGGVVLTLRDLSARRLYEAEVERACRRQVAEITLAELTRQVEAYVSATEQAVRQLGEDLGAGPGQRLELLLDCVGRVEALGERLVPLGTQRAPESEPVDLSALLRHLVDQVQDAAPSGVTLSLKQGEGDFITVGAADDLSRAFANLVRNALQAVPRSGGTIQIELDQDREGLRAVIEDNGPGVPTALRERIWDPFFTTHPHGLGTGLGLWIVAQVVMAHGGSVTLEVGSKGSDPDSSSCGSRFVVRLPAA
jgi:PAS domain S-box-containing protein